MTPRSEVITKSMRCFDYGVASLIPVLGVFLTPVALINFKFAVIEINDRWNPARLRLYVGAALAVLSLLAHTVAGVFVFLSILRAIGHV
jgi:hypothetical protein